MLLTISFKNIYSVFPFFPFFVYANYRKWFAGYSLVYGTDNVCVVTIIVFQGYNPRGKWKIPVMLKPLPVKVLKYH